MAIGLCGGRAPVRGHDHWHRSAYHRSAPCRRRTQPGGYRAGVPGPPATRGGPTCEPRARRAHGLDTTNSIEVAKRHAVRPVPCPREVSSEDEERASCRFALRRPRRSTQPATAFLRTERWLIAPEMRHGRIWASELVSECIAGNVEMHRLAHFLRHPDPKCTRQCISRGPETDHRQRGPSLPLAVIDQTYPR